MSVAWWYTSSRMAIHALSAVEAFLNSAGVMRRCTEMRGAAFFTDRCVTSVVTTEIDVLIEAQSAVAALRRGGRWLWRVNLPLLSAGQSPLIE